RSQPSSSIRHGASMGASDSPRERTPPLVLTSSADSPPGSAFPCSPRTPEPRSTSVLARTGVPLPSAGGRPEGSSRDRAAPSSCQTAARPRWIRFGCGWRVKCSYRTFVVDSENELPLCLAPGSKGGSYHAPCDPDTVHARCFPLDCARQRRRYHRLEPDDVEDPGRREGGAHSHRFAGAG